MAELQTNLAAAKFSLSERVSRISVSATQAVVMEAAKLRSQGASLVDFGAGEPDFFTPDNIKEAAIRAIRENHSKYTPAAGTAELRQAIVERHAADFGSSYVPSEIIATAGGKQAIFNLICSLVNPGDDVILPVPYWVTFCDCIRYAGGRPVMVETREEESFALTAEMIQSALTPQTRLVIVNSPSNPSGAVIPSKEMERILEVTAAHGAMLLSDECYCYFLYEESPFSIGSLPEAKEHLILVGSLSKTYAMTGWRLGYAMAPAPLVKAMLKLQSHSTSNPTSIVQQAGIEALKGPQGSVQLMLQEYRRRREFVVEKLREIPGVTCTLPQGAFYAYPNVSAFLSLAEGSGGKPAGAASANELAGTILREAGVVMVPGEAFGTKQHFRLSYANSLSNLEEGLKRLKRFFAEQGN